MAVPTHALAQFATTARLPTLEAWHQSYLTEELWWRADWYDILSQDAVIDEEAVKHLVHRKRQHLVLDTGLCAACRGLLTDWTELRTSVCDTDVLSSCWLADSMDIEAACHHGCRLCAIFWTQLQEAEQLDTLRRVERRLHVLGQEQRSTVMVTASNDHEGLSLHLHLPGRARSQDTLQSFITAITVEPAVHSYPECQADESWQRIASDWLRHCSQTHDCIKDIQAPLPTRLIRVANNAVHLVCTDTLTTRPHYATLSYSWGRDEFLMLKRESYLDFQAGLPYDSLPNVFKDAVVLTRALGLDYIWIDALCIIQKDAQDWLQESGTMAAIYGGSYVNISAATSLSVQGTLYSMPQHHRKAFMESVTDSDGKVTKLMIYEDSAVQTAIIDAHLTSRAWTHQERLLAPRSIHYGDQGMFWECKHVVASNFLPSWHPGGLNSQVQRLDHGVWDWELLVHKYSLANLTCASDKLPALAGLARRHAELQGGKYIAGLWEEDLVRQLAWRSRGVTSRPEWRAPSWSWASVDGPIWSPHDRDAETWIADRFIQVLHVHASPAGPDEYGQIDGAGLRVACRTLIPVQAGVSSKSITGQHERACVSKSGHLLRAIMDAPKQDLLQEQDVLYWLPLFGRSMGPDTKGQLKPHWRHLVDINGIVLQPVGPVKGCFRRVGGFVVGKLRDLELVADMLDHAEQSAAPAVCVEHLQGQEATAACYVIDII